MAQIHGDVIYWDAVNARTFGRISRYMWACERLMASGTDFDTEFRRRYKGRAPVKDLSGDSVYLIYEPFLVRLLWPQYTHTDGENEAPKKRWRYKRHPVDITEPLASAPPIDPRIRRYLDYLEDRRAGIAPRTYDPAKNRADAQHFGFTSPYHFRIAYGAYRGRTASESIGKGNVRVTSAGSVVFFGSDER